MSQYCNYQKLPIAFLAFLKGLQTKMAKSILEFPSHSIDYSLLAKAMYNMLKEFQLGNRWIWNSLIWSGFYLRSRVL